MGLLAQKRDLSSFLHTTNSYSATINTDPKYFVQKTLMHFFLKTLVHIDNLLTEFEVLKVTLLSQWARIEFDSLLIPEDFQCNF